MRPAVFAVNHLQCGFMMHKTTDSSSDSALSSTAAKLT